jgi:hypothetical protein
MQTDDIFRESMGRTYPRNPCSLGKYPNLTSANDIQPLVLTVQLGSFGKRNIGNILQSLLYFSTSFPHTSMRNNPTPKKKPNRLAYGISLGLAFGAAIGAAIGLATNNLGVWLPVGTACGMTIGIAIGVAADGGNKKPAGRNRRR